MIKINISLIYFYYICKKNNIMKLKEPTDIKQLNFNSLAFFTDKSTSDAKWDMSTYFYSPDDIIKNLTKTGVPKISINDLVNKSDFETKIKSCSNLDGLNKIDFIIETYNKGVPMDRLLKYANSETFQNALKFTGKHTILNDILNKEQLSKLERTWLLKNTYCVKYWSKKCVQFIQLNKWCTDYLAKNAIYESDILQQIERLNSK